MKDKNDKLSFPLNLNEIKILKLKKKLRFYMAYAERLENEIKHLKSRLEKFDPGQ